MKKIFVLGFTFLLCACGSDGGSNYTNSNLSPPSDPIYDYRNYTSETPEATDIDGFWLVIARYRQSMKWYDESGALNQSDIGTHERVKLVSIYQLNNGDIQVTDPSNIYSFSKPLIITPAIDANNDDIVTWHENLLGYYHLSFVGTSEMTGKLTQSEPILFGTNVTGKLLASEVYAVKIADFPTGKYPDDNGNINLDSSLFGTLNFDISTIGAVAPADLIDFSTLGHINHFERTHFVGEQTFSSGNTFEIDLEIHLAFSYHEHGYQYINLLKNNASCNSQADVYFTNTSTDELLDIHSDVNCSDDVYSISIDNHAIDGSTDNIYATDRFENYLISGAINLDLTPYLVVP
jgi:hypothetical protein